jgi:predicted metal-dependent peptidase
MAKKNKQERETPLDKTRRNIEMAKRRLSRSVLSQVLYHARIVECKGKEGDPAIGCVDARQGIVWLNPHRSHALQANDWTFVLGHLLLHMGLDHQKRRGDRDHALWNQACDFAADSMATAFGLGRAPGGMGAGNLYAGLSEEEIYERLWAERQDRRDLETYAGPRRCDLIESADDRTAQDTFFRSRPRRDWDRLLVEGIREHVVSAVEEASETLGAGEAKRRKEWLPGERARKWVMQNFPLLGAVAAHMTIVASEQVCDSGDISIAAVDAYLGEIYFRPSRGLSPQEILFVYCHELLHAALLHHSRGRGRDPLIWNFACDFVINDWLIQMGVGQVPASGLLYDPRLTGMSADEVYDILTLEPGRCRKAQGFRGRLGDVLLDSGGRRIYRDDVATVDDILRRCIAAGLSCMGRGTVPAGLEEEIKSLHTPPVPWDVELARWMEQHVPTIREPLRSYARASRRQSSTPDIPRPGRYVPQEWKDACTFGVVMDTSGSMDRELLGRALGAIASYAEARDVPQVRLVQCDAVPYDRGYIAPHDLRSTFSVKGRGGTVLQPAINHLIRQADFPAAAPVMVITDGWCEEELLCPREHCFVLPRKTYAEGAMLLRTSAPVFRVLKQEHYE